jgi:ketosteroid isomerase-like protein
MAGYRKFLLLLAAWLLVEFTVSQHFATCQAQQTSDMEKIATAIESFNAALSARDMGSIERIWAHDPHVIVISPRDQSFSFGWDAVKRHWEDVFAFWSHLQVSLKEKSQIHIHNGVAWAYSVANAEGQIRTGQPLAFSTMVTDIFEKPGDAWLMVSHHASRKPE